MKPGPRVRNANAWQCACGEVNLLHSDYCPLCYRRRTNPGCRFIYLPTKSRIGDVPPPPHGRPVESRSPNSRGAGASVISGQSRSSSLGQIPVNPNSGESQKGSPRQEPRSPDQVEAKKDVTQTSSGGTASLLDELFDEFVVLEATDSLGNTSDEQASNPQSDLENPKAETGRILTQGEYPFTFDVTRHAWRSETTAPFPTNLEIFSLTWSVVRKFSPSTADRVKLLLEAYTGEPWLWWPFRPPKPPLGQGKVRLQWEDNCCRDRWLDISESLLQSLQNFLSSRHPVSAIKTSSHITAASHSQDLTQSAGSAANPSSPFIGHTQTALASSSNTAAVSTSSQFPSVKPSVQTSFRAQGPQLDPSDRFLLLCTEVWGRNRTRQIVISVSDSDDDFFTKFKLTYRELRGFWQYWFHPRQFAFCHASKFERWAETCLGKLCNEMPAAMLDEYEFEPKPAVKPYTYPPICEHEWVERIYYGKRTNRRREALTRLPLRTVRHQIDIHVNGREIMWGLDAQLRPAAAIIIGWMAVIVLGAFIFVPVWLSSHPGDLQNATVPAMLLIGALALLWIPLSSKFKKE